MEIEKLSEEILYQVKTGASYQEIELKLQRLSYSDLIDLHSDNQKKSFWINIYNAYFQILRKDRGISKPDIYKKKLVLIAGKEFSLDDIEHGILRKFRFKYSLGFLADPLVPKHIKDLSVSHIDYRIHFALNCGAKSCPPIAFYTLENIDEQLELSTLSFLEADTQIDETRKSISISQLFKWYLADFGGKKGVKKVISEKLNIDLKGYNFKFNPYSWEEHLDNYV